MSLAAAPPLIALGPPGWIALGVLTVGTGIVMLAASRWRDRDRAVPRAETRAQPCTDCPRRPWSVRVQAQGDDIGGRGGATIGPPAIVKTSSPVTAAEGVALATTTYGMLERRQRQARELAYARCVRWIGDRPSQGGFLGKQSFKDDPRSNERFDVDSFGVSNNFVS